MSRNNIIYINKKTYKVYHQGCADNEDRGELIGQGKNLEEAVEIAENYDIYPEYGISFSPPGIPGKKGK